MATLLYHHIIEDIRSITKDPTYRLVTRALQDDLLQLTRDTTQERKRLSPRLSPDAMGAWLEAYRAGLEDGYLVAKRGH